LVTSASDEEAWNFGLESNLDHSVRYKRGAEFVQVVDELLDSWDEGAVLADKTTGRYSDAAKVRPIDHDGEFFKVRGPLNISRPPQRKPALFQAGASEDGKNLAAATADAVFTLGSGTLESAQELYQDYKRRVEAAGRDRDALAVMPMLAPVIGSTESEARERADLILELTPDQVALDLLSHRLETDLSAHDPDEIFSFDFVDSSTVQQSQSAYLAIQKLVDGRSLTLRQVYQAIAGRGFLVGTPEKVADRIEERFTQGAADGFILMAPSLPSGLVDVVDQVVPLLVERGIYPSEYEGATLRENLGVSTSVKAASLT
ncbi:MAG: hypothetical protein JWP75_3108, partial [Frondihabitans sp.]|nr:hypothetical protein [Frondihabitans sp.]